MSGFNIKIIVDNTILKPDITGTENIIYLHDETPYSIQLENNNNTITDVNLRIDGKKMGTYRLIPNETYKINRPIRRKKELVFLKKKEKYGKTGLYKENNCNLGIIEAEFRIGVINIKNNETCKKKVFRPENEGYIPEYMNIYKNIYNKEKIVLVNTNDNECSKIESNESSEPNNTEYDEEFEKPEKCISPCAEIEIREQVEPENCGTHNMNFDVSPCMTSYQGVEISETETEISGIPIMNNSNIGFTVYGDEINNKFKTYHQLLYYGEPVNIKIHLKNNKTYEKL